MQLEIIQKMLVMKPDGARKSAVKKWVSTKDSTIDLFNKGWKTIDQDFCVPDI